ncbi:DUF1737 domain-containing protein [Altererythrobacter sp.]|nr:DUF1737 domain-containing protein [Altererythrobacter sp.]
MHEKQVQMIDRLVSKGKIDPEVVLSAVNAIGPRKITREELLEHIQSSPKLTEKDSHEIVSEIQGKVANEKIISDALEIALKANLVIDHLNRKINAVLCAKPTAYDIESAKTQAALSARVNERMARGWVPIGGVSAAAFGISPTGGNQYIQAIARFD